MRTTICSIIALTSLAFAVPARAQEVTRMPEKTEHAVGLDGGLETAFVARASYAHRVDFGFVPDGRINARFTLPVVAPDFGDWGIDGGVQASVARWNDFRVALQLGPVLRRTDNRLFSAFGIGVGATLLIGYEGPRWGLSAEASYEQFLTTYLSHSDDYRDAFYAGAKDGWYAFSGSTARAGIRGGVRFGSVEIFAKAGMQATGQLHAGAVPFYATLGSAYAF